MGVSSGPDFVSSGCVLAVDASNRKSYIDSIASKSFINMDAWTAGSGGTTGYNQNGDTVENQRVVDTDPWGNANVVWETRASGNGNADGGWENGYYSIDRSKMYRFSVWMRRTSSSSGGTFYFGAYGNGPTWGLAHTSDGTVNGNTYWECSGTSRYTQNQWYLVVGHIYPYGTPYTGRHPDTGFYTRASGNTKVMDINGCNIGSGDLKWLADTTTTLHRTYHFYCSDSTTRLQFYSPRVDLCDGTEPRIEDLLNGSFNTAKDITSNNSPTYANIVGHPTLSSDNKYWTFNGTNSQYINVYRTDLNGGTFAYTQVTAIAWVWIDNSSSGENNIATVENAFEFRWINNGNGTSALAFASNPWAWIGSGTVTNGVWQMITFRHGASTGDFFSNATLLSSTSISGNITAGSGSYPMLSLMSRSGNGSSPAKGRLGSFYLYNRALTDSEIKQNFYATRGKYGV